MWESHVPHFALIPDLEEVGEFLGVDAIPAEEDLLQSRQTGVVVGDHSLLLSTQVRRVKLVV